jgi:transforming growth factor-beta-induced protein
MKTTLVALVALLAVVVAQPNNRNTIAQNIALIPQLSTLNSVITSAAYKPVFDALNNSAATLTLFAPNNDAFNEAKVDPSQVDVVTQVLYYHVLLAAVNSSSLQSLQFPHTAMSSQTYVNLGAGIAQVLGVEKNSNGVFVTWGIPGQGGAYSAKVVEADIASSNGYIHIINKVEGFPANVSTTASEADLTELISALDKAGLVDAVDSTAALTIFAPTNAAMNAANWKSLDTATLKTVLTYHVVPAVAYSTQLKNNEVVPTLQGETLTILLQNGGVEVVGKNSRAKVVLANALTQNGVVHVIDTVLLP